MLAALIVTLVAYASGVRGDSLFAVVFLALWPMHFLLVFITMRLFPPDVECTGDFRGILYGVIPEDDAVTRPVPAPDGSGSPNQLAAASQNGSMFSHGKEPRTLEGVVLRGAAIILVLSCAWMAVRPLIYRIAPELGATKSGPPGFPVTVHIGADSISFTNGSTAAWSCEAELGVGDEHSSAFPVDPQETRALSYVDFRGADSQVDAATLRDAARRKITIGCVEPSGTSHFWQFR